jgi:hypothetical protein
MVTHFLFVLIGLLSLYMIYIFVLMPIRDAKQKTGTFIKRLGELLIKRAELQEESFRIVHDNERNLINLIQKAVVELELAGVRSQAKHLILLLDKHLERRDIRAFVKNGEFWANSKDIFNLWQAHSADLENFDIKTIREENIPKLALTDLGNADMDNAKKQS